MKALDENSSKFEENWSDGAIYEGSHKDGKRHGKGNFIWPNGDEYNGEFKNNNLHGQGKFKWADGKTYEGSWTFNKMDGVSRFLFFLTFRKEFLPGETVGGTKGTIKWGLRMAVGPLNLGMEGSISENGARGRCTVRVLLFPKMGKLELGSGILAILLDGSRVKSLRLMPKPGFK